MTYRAILALVVAFAGWTPSDAFADEIDGTWIPSSATLSGKEFPEEIRKSIRLVVKDGKYNATVGKNEDRGSVRIDPTAKPKTLDITSADGPTKGMTILCIYERVGDRLTVCYDLSGKNRPTEFVSTPGTPRFLVTYIRQKD